MKKKKSREDKLTACTVPQGCHNRVAQTGWLGTAETYSLTVLEAGGLRSKYQEGCAPWKLLEDSSLHHSASGCTFGLWQHHSSLCPCLHMAVFPLYVCVCTWHCPLCHKDINPVGLKAHPNDHILT